MKDAFITVVIPVFRSGELLPELLRRLRAVLSSLTDRWEILLVDDASNDGSFSRMLELREQDNRVKLIRFAHNMGQHHATLCGLQSAQGDYVITLDDDLQNPPEEIPGLIAKLEEGYDLVIGEIIGQKNHSWHRNIASKIIQILIGKILGKPKGLRLSSYRAMTRHAAAKIASFKGVHVYLPGLILNNIPTDRICNAPVSHHERVQGKSNYTLRKSLRLVSYLLINHTRLPLRIMTTWGFIISIASFVYAIFVIIKVTLYGSSYGGWPSLAVLISFFSGNILFSIGVLGEYIGRLIEENNRASQFPIYEEYL